MRQDQLGGKETNSLTQSASGPSCSPIQRPKADSFTIAAKHILKGRLKENKPTDMRALSSILPSHPLIFEIIEILGRHKEMEGDPLKSLPPNSTSSQI